MSEEVTAPQGIALDQKNIDILVANIIPTTKYFESRFDHLQYQLDAFKSAQQELKVDIGSRFTMMKSDMDSRFIGMKSDMDSRFIGMKSDMDSRFIEMKSDMDKRFEQVDVRFVEIKADMDKRFEQIDQKLDKILDRIDRRIDEGLRENRAQAMRMFTFAMTFSAISMVGLIGKFLKLY
jgi:DNA anti-recombination protein RmuC